MLDNKLADPTLPKLAPTFNKMSELVGFTGPLAVVLLPTMVVFRGQMPTRDIVTTASMDLHLALRQPSLLVYHSHPMENTLSKPGKLGVAHFNKGLDAADLLVLRREGLWRFSSTTRSFDELLALWTNGSLPCGDQGCHSFEDSVKALSAGDAAFRRGSSVMQPAEQPFIFFVHMPKAAGSTLADVLQEVTPRCSGDWSQCKLIRGHSESLASTVLNRSRSIGCQLYGCRGHADFGAISELMHALPLGKRPLLVTMLREPVSRLISEFW